ncbi:precorrin-4 C(11)-methyltransferase [Fundidesulfovibrio butyratiphilus]
MLNPRVHFVGAGPGDPELLTVRAARLLSQADVVLYPGSLTPAPVVNLAKPGAETIDTAPLTLEQTHAVIANAYAKGLDVVRLQAGDPCLYGTIAEQAALLEAEGIAYDVTPGVTAASAAAAALRVSATVPERNQTLILTRPAGRTPMPPGQSLSELASHGAAMAVYLGAQMPEAVRDELLAGGYPPDTPVAVVHKVGWPEEQLHMRRLDDFADLARERDLTVQTLFFVLPGQGEATRSRLYHPDFAHSRRPARKDVP